MITDDPCDDVTHWLWVCWEPPRRPGKSHAAFAEAYLTDWTSGQPTPHDLGRYNCHGKYRMKP